MEIKYELSIDDYLQYNVDIYTKIRENNNMIFTKRVKMIISLLIGIYLMFVVITYGNIESKNFTAYSIIIILSVLISGTIFTSKWYLKKIWRKHVNIYIKNGTYKVDTENIVTFVGTDINVDNKYSKTEVSMNNLKIVLITKNYLYLGLGMMHAVIIPIYKLGNKDEVIKYIKDNYNGDLREVD